MSFFKKNLTKLTPELQSSWTQLLPLAILRLRISPHSDIHLSPFERLYGRPFLPTDLRLDPEFNALAAYAASSGQTLQEIHSFANTHLPTLDFSLAR